MTILGENYDERFGLDEYDPYDPFCTTASERNERDYEDYDTECEAYGHIGYRDPWDADFEA